MKKEKETKEYREFVEQFKTYILLITENWDSKVTFIPDGETESETEDLLEVRLSGDGRGTHIQRFHMEKIYHDFKMGKDLEELFLEASDCLERCREIGMRSPLSRMEDYGAIRDYLIIRPLNYVRNAEKLKDGIYEIRGDIALTLYVSIGDFGGLYTSSMTPKGVFEGWNKNRLKVLEDAMENTYKLFPPRLLNWLDADRFQEENYGAFMEESTHARVTGDTCATFVTTKSQINGAVAVFFPGVAKRLSDLMGNDLYIAFTSMHEAAIHNCAKVTPETIRESLKGLNEEFPCGDDFLSDKVYYYNRKENVIAALPDLIES